MATERKEEFHDGNTIRHYIVGDRGKIEAVVACMFGGKTEELVDIAARIKVHIEKLKEIGTIPEDVDPDEILVVVKHSFDDRYGDDADSQYGELRSHSGASVEARKINDPHQVYDFVTENTAVLLIDEGQFFNQHRDIDTPEGGEVRIFDLALVAEDLAYNKGIRVVIAGLDTDFRGEVFGPMGQILTIAEETTQKYAICVVCGDNHATRTQRIVNGEPANYNDPLILVGAKEDYEARCPICHKVPDRPY